MMVHACLQSYDQGHWTIAGKVTRLFVFLEWLDLLWFDLNLALKKNQTLKMPVSAGYTAFASASASRVLQSRTSFRIRIVEVATICSIIVSVLFSSREVTSLLQSPLVVPQQLDWFDAMLGKMVMTRAGTALTPELCCVMASCRVAMQSTLYVAVITIILDRGCICI